MHVIARGSLVVFALAAAAPLAHPQNQPRSRTGPPPLQYNFQPPGARSLGMGAAFIGLADDATASESNPAGLTILTKPEVSAHFRSSALENEAPNTVAQSGFATFEDRVSGPGFVSVVMPWKRVAAAAYYQRAADFRSHAVFDGVVPVEGAGDLANYDQVETAFKVENIGLSGAVKLGARASVGASLRITRLSLDALQKTTFPYSSPFFGIFDFDGFLERGFIDVNATKSKLTWNAGALFTPVQQVTLGAVYKKGARYDFEATRVLDTVRADGVTLDDSEPVGLPVRIPDVFGVGAVVRPAENWSLLVDVVRVRYSQADPGPEALNFYQLYGEGGREALDDGTEFHVGAEYTWPGGNDWLFAARAGYYSDPDHDGLAGLDSRSDHFTLGGGFVVKNRLQLDVAANLAGNVKEGLISMVVRF